MDLTISTTIDQLRAMLREEAMSIVDTIIKNSSNTTLSRKLSIDEAREYLLELGYKTSVASLYRYVSSNEIPFEKFGARIVFDCEQLREWASSRNPKYSDPVEIIAKSARNKSSYSSKK